MEAVAWTALGMLATVSFGALVGIWRLGDRIDGMTARLDKMDALLDEMEARVDALVA